MTRSISDKLLRNLSGLCAERLGLSFAPARWDELERGLRSAARDLGFPGPEPLLQQLLGSPPSRKQLDALASHLTVGETYFYRDPQAFRALEEHILPELAQKSSDRRLRIWSAGCSTGEEAYSLAIAVSRTLPDWKEWNLTILATDVNPRSLQKASRGLYSDWSFRDGPPWVREIYFRKTPGGRYQVREDIRSMIRFAYLNMAQDHYPSLLNNTNAMDLIFCRNMLMYFTPDRAEIALHKLGQALVPQGWLFVSPSEIPHSRSGGLATVAVNGSFVLRKTGVEKSPPGPEAGRPFPFPPPLAAPASRLPASASDPGRGVPPISPALLARGYANQGRLAEALECCDRALAADRLDPGLHYLRSTILQEQASDEEAASSLKRALYLDPDFVLAHLGLGNLFRRNGRPGEAARHFRNCLSLLAGYPPERIVPESEGIPAGRLREIIESTIEAVSG